MINSMKKILLLLMSLILLLAACGKSDNPNSKENEMLVSLLLDEYGIEDQAINSKAYQGLLDLKVDTGIAIDYQVAAYEADYEASIESLIQRGAKLVWGVGYQTADAIQEAAHKNKDLNFASLDNIYDEDSMPKNLTGSIFNTEETSYLLGYVAGLATKTNRLAYLGHQRGVLSDKDEFGFRAGVYDASKERQKKINLSIEYLQTYSDQGKGRTIAKSLYDSGVDIIFTNAGLGDLGAIDAAKEKNKFVLVTDSQLIKQAPNHVMLAAEKKYEEAINTISSRFIAKEAIGGKNFELGLKNNCLDISPYDEDKNLIEASIYQKALKKKKDIVDGKKIVPYDQKTFDKFSSSK
ncbi:MAG: BMP family ABC transporter substrate-binding protein [Tissierellia bacterium]|nr:BMP family ABC transporter substrate-binding protein [Tissierellia bacterium]